MNANDTITLTGRRPTNNEDASYTCKVGRYLGGSRHMVTCRSRRYVYNAKCATLSTAPDAGHGRRVLSDVVAA